MNPSSPRCPSDEAHVSKFSLLGQQLTTCHSFQHSQPSSDYLGLGYIPHSQAQAQGRATCQNLQSLGETQALDRATCQNLQSLGQTQAPTGSSGSGVSLSLQQLLVNNMGSYSPHLNTQLMQGLQESLGQLRGIAPRGPSPLADASSQALMTALMLLQQKLGHLQTLVQLMAQGDQSNPAAIQQQMATATGVSTVISELVTAAARLLPQVYQQAPPAVCEERSHLGAGSSSDMAFFQQNGSVNSLGAILGISSGNSRSNASAVRRESNSGFGSFVSETELDGSSELGGHLFGALVGNFLSNNIQNSIETCPENSLSGSFALGLGAGAGGTINLGEGNRAVCVGNPLMSNISMEINSFLEDHDLRGGFKDDEDDGETETLPPGSYELIEMDAMEILAEHTHFCEICGKGFKRDANLRMHMRGHGDEYKTVAALAKPGKSTQDVSSRKPRRYSCPYPGCKRNKKHKKFLPLKALLCVKNHYRRSHCPKMLTCNKCKAKKFSVVADLKTHEKHCGREKWKCSCGTTFSRKDKLLGHVGLFVGHTPAMPLHETDSGGSGGGMERKKSEPGTASGNATTHFSLTESGVHSGRRDESSFEYGYGLGLSGSKLDSVSVSSNGDASGSRLKLGGKGTGEEGMTLAAAHITPTKDGLEASSGP